MQKKNSRHEINSIWGNENHLWKLLDKYKSQYKYIFVHNFSYDFKDNFIEQ